MIDNHEQLYEFDQADFWLVIQEEYPITSYSSIQIELNDQMEYVGLTSYAAIPLKEHIEQGLVEWGATSAWHEEEDAE